MPIEPAVFWTFAATLVATLSANIAIKTKERRFKEFFGTNVEICAKLWTLCLPLLPESASPVHLLWALYFLKQYNTEGVILIPIYSMTLFGISDSKLQIIIFKHINVSFPRGLELSAPDR